MKITCHKKVCKAQIPRVAAFRSPEDHQLYCSKQCADRSTPKVRISFVLQFLEGVYEKRMSRMELV